MKIIVCLAFLFLEFSVVGQLYTGKVVNPDSGEPLEYASVGIINTSFGAITDENGNYAFQVKELADTTVLRVSMIGYESQSFNIADVVDSDFVVQLVEKPVKLDEVIINPMTERLVGTKGFNRSEGWSGWGGMQIRKGFEIGLRLNLGDKPLFLKDLNVLLHRQAFDTSYYRLHIRTVSNSDIGEELLNENIIVHITNEKGWAKIDLQSYNIVLSGDVAVTLEWLKVKGLNKDREMKINNRMQDAYVLFKNKKNQTGVFRWGTEAKWNFNSKNSPSIYLTVME